jgi:ABC-type lipoprotein export system ATPase subunit
MSLLLEVTDLEKAYGSTRVLTQVSLSIAHGQFVGLMGPSGCGKSTLLNIVGGLDTPNTGLVQLEGIEVPYQEDSLLSRYRQKQVATIFQFFNLLSAMTVLENVMAPAYLAGKERPQQIEDRAKMLLEQVGLSDKLRAYPAQLSGGQMQRTAIARALINSPKLILADEPTGNLDTESGRTILNVLKELCLSQQTSILMASHSTEATAYCHTIYTMRDGQLVS